MCVRGRLLYILHGVARTVARVPAHFLLSNFIKTAPRALRLEINVVLHCAHLLLLLTGPKGNSSLPWERIHSGKREAEKEVEAHTAGPLYQSNCLNEKAHTKIVLWEIAIRHSSVQLFGIRSVWPAVMAIKGIGDELFVYDFLISALHFLSFNLNGHGLNLFIQSTKS